MKITLPSHLVAYSLYAKVVAADPNQGRSVRGLGIQFPPGAVEPANAGGFLTVGPPNAAATAVDAVKSLAEGDDWNVPQDSNSNSISMNTWSLISTVDGAVVYVTPIYA